MTQEKLREELNKAETLLAQVQDEIRNARAVLALAPEYEAKYARKVADLRAKLKQDTGKR